MARRVYDEQNRVEQEFKDLNTRNAWPLVYQRIGMECQRFPYTWNEAKKPRNKPLNRYRDVNPFDHTRVVLKRCEETDYINANFVTLERANRRYILTQGPLAFTVGHFWLMIWEQNTKAILMFNKVIEKNEVKCHYYWPPGPGTGNSMIFDDVQLAVTVLKDEDCCYYSTRRLKLYDLQSDTSKEVVQYHYTTWPDFGVPTSPVAFLHFLRRVRESGVLDPTDGPPVIHCSAGIGRSGTFCLVDCCLIIVEKEGIENLDIQETLLDLRRQRMGLIQTPDQLQFSYQAVINGAKRLDPNYQETEEEKELLRKEKAMKEERERQERNNQEGIYEEVEGREGEGEEAAGGEAAGGEAAGGEEEAPPPPPPRAESLTKAPARPLPAIPTSESLGNLNLTVPQESSSSDECPPTPTARESSSAGTSAEEEEEPTVESVAQSVGEPTDTVRQRRNRELAERVSGMKKRAREAEQWHALKRFKTEDDKQKKPCED